MTLIYIFWGEFPGFTDVLACAKKRAGCPIIVVSDGAPPPGVKHIPIQNFKYAETFLKLAGKQVGKGMATCIARWFVLRDLLLTTPLNYPIFCSDWDILIFENLEKAHAPFLDFDYAVSTSDGISSAAYAINSRLPLDEFCAKSESLFSNNEPVAQNQNDMAIWRYVSGTGKFKVGNLNQVVDSRLFDHNMHCGESEFVFDGPAKRVQFVEGYPFFQAKDGSLIKAVTFHCWGTYHTRTKEMRERAGIPL